MTKNEQDWHRQIQSEADEHLFQDLHFDFRMKEQVLNNVKRETRKMQWMQRGLSKWAVGAAAAAMITGIIFLSSSIFNPEVDLNMAIEGTKENAGNIFGIDPDSTEVDTLMLDPDNEPMRTLTSLDGMEEAAIWFGDQLLVPGYIPESFELVDIVANGLQAEVTTEILMQYSAAAEAKTYEVVQRKQDRADISEQARVVDIHGVDGYMTTHHRDTLDGRIESSSIQWFVEGVQYRVAGMISEVEALDVARSLVSQD